MAKNEVALVVALAIVFMVLPILAVALRIWVKVMKRTRLAPDDYLIFLALAFTLGTGACQLVAAYKGDLGQHLTYSMSPEIPDQMHQLVIYLQAQYAFELLAQLAIVSAKLSLILLYRRIFVNSSFKLASWIIGSIVLVWHGAFFFAFAFQCTPVEAVWDLTITSSTCVNKIVVWEAYAISDVLTDTLVLSMPIPAILKLQMATRQKVGVILAFLLGAIVIATGITRTAFFFQIGGESFADLTYIAVPTWNWSFIETSLGTVCACLPTLRPLFAQQPAGSFLHRIQGFMSLRSNKGSKLSNYAENRSDDRSAQDDSAARNSGKRNEDFYNTQSSYDVYIDSQPLVGMTAAQKSLRKDGILVSSEIQQSK